MCKVNSKFHMVIRNTNTNKKNEFLKKAKALGLTISNNRETDNGIEKIRLGHTISVGTSKKFHVNYAKRHDYYTEKAVVPVYDFNYDWNEIIARLKAYAAAVNPTETRYTTSNGNVAVYNRSNKTVTIGNTRLTVSDVKAIAAFSNN